MCLQWHVRAALRLRSQILVEVVDPSRSDVAAITGVASPVIAARPGRGGEQPARTGQILPVQKGIRVLRSAVTQQLR
jgi:hypothetical protein